MSYCMLIYKSIWFAIGSPDPNKANHGEPIMKVWTVLPPDNLCYIVLSIVLYDPLRHYNNDFILSKLTTNEDTTDLFLFSNITYVLMQVLLCTFLLDRNKLFAS